MTRDEFYARLRERMPGAPAPLTAFDREVLLRRSAHAAHTAGAEPPFNLRPGLVGEILALYDELRRRHKTVADFDRLMTGTLESSAPYDRGAARLLAQTRLPHRHVPGVRAGARRGRPASTSTACARWRSRRAHPLYRRLIVTVADQAADRRGLWTADFDLFARMPGVEAIDVVATEALLESGYYERLHESLLPGIEDVRLAAAPPALRCRCSARRPRAPVPAVRRRAGASCSEPFVCRDREEELAEFVRALKSRAARHAARTDGDRLPASAAVSLPGAAGLRRRAGALSGARRAAAGGGAVCRGGRSRLQRDRGGLHARRARRAAAVPAPRVRRGRPDAHAEDVHALDRYLVEKKYLGDVERLAGLSDRARAGAPAALAAAAVGRAGAERRGDAPTAPAQIDGILAFIASRERAAGGRRRVVRAPSARPRGRAVGAADAPGRARGARSGAAVDLGAVGRGAAMDRRPDLLAAPRRRRRACCSTPARRRTPTSTRSGSSASPRRTGRSASTRSIFYPQSLLAQLGWPGEQDRFPAARARFHDLLRLPRRRVSLSTFTLEDDAIVSPSPLLEDVDAAGLPIERLVDGPDAPQGDSRVFVHEALAIDPVAAGGRARRSGGVAGPPLVAPLRRAALPRPDRTARAPSTYAVSRLERYLECPFKYFAAHILKLPEERDEQAWMTPQERGQFVHAVFESFFAEWQRLGHGAITTANVAEAIALFDTVAERHLAALPEGDRALERTLLLGSAAAAGFGERAFAFEIDDDIPVVERLLEYQLEDTFTFAGRRRARGA